MPPPRRKAAAAAAPAAVELLGLDRTVDNREADNRAAENTSSEVRPVQPPPAATHAGQPSHGYAASPATVRVPTAVEAIPAVPIAPAAVAAPFAAAAPSVDLLEALGSTVAMDLDSPLAGLDDDALRRMRGDRPAAPAPAAGRPAAPAPAAGRPAAPAPAAGRPAAPASVSGEHSYPFPSRGSGARATAILEAQRAHPLDDEPRAEGELSSPHPVAASPSAAAVPSKAAAPASVSGDVDRHMTGVRSGSIINERYCIEKMIGRGGMGTVYSVRHTNTDERLALKLLHPALAENDDTIARFRTEARAPVRIGSEHVVRVVDADVSKKLGVPFMVMELLEGHDLRSELQRRGALPAGEVVLYLGQLARALDKAHAKGIVHRDLKPANLYLVKREDGSPLLKVLDFGIAKLTDDAAKELTMAGQVFGTPWYMAPEQAKGNLSSVGGCTDLWAVGLIAYKLLTGRNYWTAEGMAALVAQICYEPMPPPTQSAPHLGPLFDMWFARACNREPDQRFGSAREMVSELAQALGVNQTGAGLTTGGNNFADSSLQIPMLSGAHATGPNLGISPAMGLSVPPMGTSNPSMGASVPPMGTSNPSMGASVPPMGTSNPGMGASVRSMGTSNPGMGVSVPPGTDAPLYSTQPPIVSKRGSRVGLLVGGVVALMVAAGAAAIYFLMPPPVVDNSTPPTPAAQVDSDINPAEDGADPAADGDDNQQADDAVDEDEAATAPSAQPSAEPSAEPSASASASAAAKAPPSQPTAKPPSTGWRPPVRPPRPPTPAPTSTAPKIGPIKF